MSREKVQRALHLLLREGHIDRRVVFFSCVRKRELVLLHLREVRLCLLCSKRVWNMLVSSSTERTQCTL